MLKNIKNRGEILAWCFFDFANSSFTTIVITIVYSVYFVRIVAGGGGNADQLWGLGNLISQGAVLLLAPLLGAIADYSACKKRFLFLTYITCVTFTGLMFFVTPGAVWLGLILYIIANFAFSSGENLIASFLPEIAEPKDMGKISGFGWSLGYVGGLLCLVACLPFIKGGFELSNQMGLRMTNVVVAVFFLVAGIPTFLFVKERKVGNSLPPGESYISVGVKRIRETFEHIRRFRELFKFLIIFGIYNCGVTSVVWFASIYAIETIRLTTSELIVFFLITQVSSSLGAFVFGLVQDKLGTRNTIHITLLQWCRSLHHDRDGRSRRSCNSAFCI